MKVLLAQIEFSQMSTFQMRPEHAVTYIGVSLVFLFTLWLFDTKTRPLGTTLIVWGILVAILSGGYALIGVPTMIAVTPTLTKMGFMLVLGGLAWSLLVAPPHSTMSPAKESDHV